MKNTTNNQFENATAKAIANLINFNKSTATLDKEKFASVYEKATAVFEVFKQRHIAIENGKDIKIFNDSCYSALRDVFAIIGKVNGFNLTATATTDGKTSRNLFDDCIRFLRKDKNINVSKEMATLICDKQTAVKKIATAKENKDIDALLTAENEVKTIAEKIANLKKKSGNCKTIDIYEKPQNFAKHFIYCISLAINYQCTLTSEQLQEQRKAKNNERKANRKGKTA